MLSSLGRVLLVATALAPILLVYGAAVFFKRRGLAISLGLAVALLVLCHFLLRRIQRHGGTERVEVEAIAGPVADQVSPAPDGLGVSGPGGGGR